MSTYISQVGSDADALEALTFLDYAASSPSQNIFHTVLGQRAFDLSTAPLGLRSGTVTYLFGSDDDAQACVDLHLSGVFQLADDERPLVNMIYAVSQGGNVVITLADGRTSAWTVAVDFQEVTL